MVASDGGVFAFGDAQFEGSCPGIGGLLGAAVAVIPDATGNGYWLVTRRATSTPSATPRLGAPGTQGSPVTSAVRTADGGGLLDPAGRRRRSTPTATPCTSAAPSAPSAASTRPRPSSPTSDGGGYWVASADGAVFPYGDAPNDGSHGRRAPQRRPSSPPPGSEAGPAAHLRPGSGSEPAPRPGPRPASGTLVAMAAQFIYTMRDLTRFYPPDREVLGASTSPSTRGRRSGSSASNGSGKSSLLRIMAGQDDGFTGEARLTPGFTVGLPGAGAPTRRGQGRGRQRRRRRRGGEATARPLQRGVRRLRRARRRLRRAPGRAGRPPDQDRRRRRLGSRADLRDRHGRAPASAGRRRRDHALGWRAPAGRPVPAAAVQARPAAPRRADEPPRCRVGRLAGAHAAGLSGHGRRRDPRPLLPRQRRRLDPRAGPRARAFPGRATTRRGWSRSRPAWPARRRPTAPARPRSSASSSGSGCRPGPGRARARRASRPTTSWWPRPRPPSGAPTRSRSPSRPARGWAIRWSTPTASSRDSATGC